MSTLTSPATRFDLPPELSATEPPEARGLARDEVGLVVSDPTGTSVTAFHRIAAHLRPGDLLVVNSSATLPAALEARRDPDGDGDRLVVHLAARFRCGDWVVELRRPDAQGPVLDGAAGQVIDVAGHRLTLLAGHPDRAVAWGSRLWRARLDTGARSAPSARGTRRLLAAHGRPISYGYLRGRRSLADYQTVFGRHPGSAEMASAGRPFSERVLRDLARHGVGIAPILLHTGVSSPEAGEPPQPERFAVGARTARRVNRTRAAGGRVIAVGTTAVRALESATDPAGTVRAAGGWTDLVLGPDRPVRTVAGLVTGWHEPGASHLLLLEAVAGPDLVAAAYATALEHRLRWHEFGDSCLLLP